MMGLLRRTTSDDDVTYRDRVDEDDGRDERVGPSPGLVRALFTLLGVAAAGLLVWLAQTITDGPLGDAFTGDFWWAVALLAGAGLVLGLSQLFGGWTKWGWPTLSPTVFLLGFLPTLVVGGWILLAKQPQDGVEEGRFDGWSGDLGISGLVNDLATFLPVIPLVIGLVLAFSFDTTGPRRRIVAREHGVRDDQVRDSRTYERRETSSVGTPRGTGTGATADTDVDPETRTTTTTTTGARTTASDSTVAEELRSRDEQPGAASADTRDERVDVRDRDGRSTS
jgi:hypothetical protein